MDLHEVYRNSGLGKWFHGESANKTPGWDRYNSEGELVGECGDAKKGESYSACLSKQKAEKLGKKGRASFVKRKRAAQSEAGRGKKGSGGKGQKPINVDTGASKMDECVQCNEEHESEDNPFRTHSGWKYDPQGREFYGIKPEAREEWNKRRIEWAKTQQRRELPSLFNAPNSLIGNRTNASLFSDFAQWRHDQMVADPEWQRRRKLHQDAVAAANAEVAAANTEVVKENVMVELINEGKNKPNDPGKWSACKSAAKKKFDVYPSAYANAWAARCYKKKGGTWKSIKEETDITAARFDGLNPGNSTISLTMRQNFNSRFGKDNPDLYKYMGELMDARKNAKHVNPTEFPALNAQTFNRTVNLTGNNIGPSATSTLQQNIAAEGRREQDELMNDAPPNQPLSKYGGASPSNTAAANRSLATAAQRKDFQNTNSTPNSENIAKAVGDKAAIATITGRTLMPKSTTDSELNASLDAYEKSVSNDTISSPEEKTATLDRIRKYRQDPKHREILRISQNNNNENSLTAVTEQLKVYTKQSIISALFENKMKDGPGKTSQRPKSFGKGGKSGTEQTQARREGKRQAQEHD